MVWAWEMGRLHVLFAVLCALVLWVKLLPFAASPWVE